MIASTLKSKSTFHIFHCSIPW